MTFQKPFLSAALHLPAFFSYVLLTSKGKQTAVKKWTYCREYTLHIYQFNFCLLQKWPPQPEYYSIDLVCVMGINRPESNTAEEDNGVLTHRRLSLNPLCPWAGMKVNSILGCTDKGKCTFIVEDSSGAFQPNICSGAFLKELDYLQF